MNLNVRYFASLRERLGSQERCEGVPEGITVGELRKWLAQRSATHAEVLGGTSLIRCALNQVMAEEQAVIGDGAEVAFFPPVTGG